MKKLWRVASLIPIAFIMVLIWQGHLDPFQAMVGALGFAREVGIEMLLIVQACLSAVLFTILAIIVIVTLCLEDANSEIQLPDKESKNLFIAKKIIINIKN